MLTMGNDVIDCVMRSDFHFTLKNPKVFVCEAQTSQPCDRDDFSIGHNPPLCHFFRKESHGISFSAVCLDHDDTDYLTAFANGHDTEITALSERAFSGVFHFQRLSAIRACTTAKGISKCAFTFPSMTAIPTSEHVLCRAVSDMFQAMGISPLYLFVSDGVKPSAQFHYLSLLCVSRFHG